MTAEARQDAHARWVAYRPEIKILDCTVRDGGLINDHQFDDDFVGAVYRSLTEAGVDYIELGYKASKQIFAPDKFGKWKFCAEDDIRRIVDEEQKPRVPKISVMADAERTDYKEAFLPREQSAIDCYRVACYIHQIPTALDMIQDAHEKGYETLFQLMAVSTVNMPDLEHALALVAESPVAGLYLVDSFGSLYSEQVRDLTKLYVKSMEGTGKEVGFHGHNNQQLAFANTIEAIISGANRLDATINGLGRGAGNCPLELLIGFLHNPKFRMRPVLQIIQDRFLAIQKEIDWGYSIPYAITGKLNQHPRAAIKMRASDHPNDYVGFYDEMTQEES